METTPAQLRQVGDSVVAALSPEVLRASGLQAGDHVVVTAEMGRIEIAPAPVPDLGLAGFAARFMDRYRADLARLADL